jgi:peptide/nickel transport system ATP-binding protein
MTESQQPVLELLDVHRTFTVSRGLFKGKRALGAVNGVSLGINRGDVLGLVGESGCGKTTLARMLLGLLPPTSGQILIDGRAIAGEDRRTRSRMIQPVFQDPYSSLNPRKMVGSIISLPLRVHKVGDPSTWRSKVEEMLDLVGLPGRVYHSYPGQLSGGQRQRVAVARALIMRPEVVICDEPTSSLDVAVQAQILNLLISLRKELGLTYLLISHNLAVAVCAGFVWSDIPEVGPSVTITGNGESPRYRALAQELQEEIWATRDEKTVQPVKIEEAMEKAKSVLPGSKPLIIADYTDNPGSGGYGDGINLLRAMVEADLPNAALASVADPEAARQCVSAGRGAKVKVELGAKIDPRTYGPSLIFDGVVENISDGAYTCEGPMNKGVRFSLGPTAVLRQGGVRVVVATHNHQVYDLQVFRTQNIEPRECSVLAVKSWHHFRAAFEPISSGVLLADSGGLASMDLKRFHYRKVRRPVYPLDLD